MTTSVEATPTKTHKTPLPHARKRTDRGAKRTAKPHGAMPPVAEPAATDLPSSETPMGVVGAAKSTSVEAIEQPLPSSQMPHARTSNAESVHLAGDSPTTNDTSALTLLRVLVKQRTYLGEHRRRTTNAAKAYARLVLGWRIGSPDAANIKASASKLVDGALAGEPVDAPAALLSMLSVYASSLAPVEVEMKSIERRLKAVVRTMPLWTWAKAERGVAEISLASLIAELGDPANYANPAKVWKRMGLAVGADGKADKNPLGGYSGRRRSVGYLIGDGMIKARHPMRVAIYDVRRAYTEANRPDWSKCRRHRDAHRVMLKAWLVRFWKVARFGSEFKTDQSTH